MQASCPTESLPDLSRSHAAPEITGKQRALVDQQLAEMRAGRVVRHFAAVAEVFSAIPAPEPARPLQLLDVGCASAYYAEVLAELTSQRFEYTGADYSDSMLEMARQLYPHIRLLKTDVRKLDISDRAYDVVLSGACLVHVQEWADALAELVRVSARWVILHRTLVKNQPPTEIRIETLYERQMYRVYLFEDDLLAQVARLGCVVRAKTHCGEGYEGAVVGNYTYLLERSSRPE